ncbi:hypothetical protein GOP47_0013706 [Adiantum capillus-veneris]|uniref:RNA helicase n=1 Tax=Adiantum capillus-veneris TaxID=13818 RepID=A0A9D4ZFL6_ADICA|nr:hypothetical protein GOP47_0013706 [Adiantum capillus-veneris]
MADELPVTRFESEIVDLVKKHDVVVIIGETGSGKTTQISQILHRAHFTASGMIAITQPRRVAAVSVARRVASEMNVRLGEEVGYSIRFEDRTSDKTQIKYLTDGCLLRELLSDSELKQYSVIILDEAHERSLNTDVLLGLLKRLAGRKCPDLKIVITSATLDGEKFSSFFSGCPVMKIPGKLFPVEVLYSTEQPINYIESAVQTALEIHTQEGPGDILLFLTGKDEIDKAIKKLEDRIRLLEEGSCMDAVILPLHASLEPELQVRVFAPSPTTCRRIIVATNIAETSLTVDGVVFVIDPGVVKQHQYSPATGMYSLVVVQISRVQATQRAGRAGRTRPGKCYRLYTETMFENELAAVTVPEIQRSSLTSAVLHLKSLDLKEVNVLEFEFLDPPSRASLEDALQQLFIIDAIREDGSITSLGKRMAVLPLEPSLSRALLAAEEASCLNEALTIAAMLSCESLFVANSKKSSSNKRDLEFKNLPDGKGLGDHIQLLQIYEEWREDGFRAEWCEQHGVKTRSMMFARDIRKQLSQIIQWESKGSSRYKQKGPDLVALRKSLCIGFSNRLAHRMQRHNGYRTLGTKSQLVQVHPSACSMEVDDDGLLPEWVVYNELVNTGRPYIRNVCAVEGSWCQPALKKLSSLSVNKLGGTQSNSGQRAKQEEKETVQTEKAGLEKPSAVQKEVVAAARRPLFEGPKNIAFCTKAGDYVKDMVCCLQGLQSLSVE